MIYNKERGKKTRKFISDSKNGIAVVILSLVSMLLVPLLGSYATGQALMPTTTIGWIIYFTSAVAVSLCCLFIYLALHNQGKLNVKDEEEYIQAKELHLKNFKRMNGKEIIPIDPFKWEKKQKMKKGIFQTLSIFLGLLGFGLAVLVWNNSQFISSCISIVMSISFGLVHMGDVERMFTEGWLEWELYVEKKLDEEDRRKAQEKAFEKEMENNTDFTQKLEKTIKNQFKEENIYDKN